MNNTYGIAVNGALYMTGLTYDDARELLEEIGYPAGARIVKVGGV